MATGPRFVAPIFQALNQIGVTVPGAELNFFLGDSDTRTPTYTNINLTGPANSNPVIADDTGLFPDIFLDPEITYKVTLTDPDDGITEPHEYWSVFPVKEAWLLPEEVFWDQPFALLGPKPTTAETIGLYIAARPQRIFGDFDGTDDGFMKAVGACLTPPADGEYVCQAYKNNAGGPVGSMLVGVDGSFTFVTDAGLPIDLDAGEFIAWRAPIVVDTVGPLGMAWTITGINL